MDGRCWHVLQCASLRLIGRLMRRVPRLLLLHPVLLLMLLLHGVVHMGRLLVMRTVVIQQLLQADRNVLIQPLTAIHRWPIVLCWRRLKLLLLLLIRLPVLLGQVRLLLLPIVCGVARLVGGVERAGVGAGELLTDGS